MIANKRESAALAKLLKVAKLKADETGRRIGVLKAAYENADASLRFLAEAVSCEAAAAKAAEVVGFAQLAGFLAGAEHKRKALEETKMQVAAEIDAARIDLDAAYSEMKKLEHLIERSRLASEKLGRRAEAAQMDEAAIASFVRKNAR